MLSAGQSLNLVGWRLRLRAARRSYPSPPQMTDAIPTPTHPPLPQVTDQADGAKLVLSLESKDCEALDAAAAQLRALLPAGALVSEHRDTGAVNCPAPAKAPV